MSAYDVMETQNSTAEQRENESRIQTLMAEADAKLDESYLLLGKAYMETHPMDYEEAVSPYARAVLEAEEAKHSLHRKLLALKGVALCEKCGAEVPEKAFFCCFCGQEMEHPITDIPVGQARCKCCGAIQQADMRFCMNCGSPMFGEMPQQLEDEGSVTEPSAEEPSTPSPADIDEPAEIEVKPEIAEPLADVPDASPEAPALRCAVCGNDLEKDAAFCTKCGAPVKQATENPNQSQSAFCINCGSPLEAGAIFCTECGARQR